MDGMFQDSMANDLPMSPKLVHTYAIRQLHVDVRMKGIKKIGFSISGTPKMIGSEILKKAGIRPTRPTVLSCLDFERQSRIASASTEPQPPMITK